MPVNKKRIVTDSFINIVASLVFTATLQLLCYPLISRFLSQDEYGMVLTLSGCANTFAAMLAVPTNNSRLLMDDKYAEIGLSGDYRIFLIAEYIAGGLGTAIFSFVLTRSLPISVCMSCIAVMTMFRSYHSVSFRLRIDYLKMLKLNLSLAFGYFVGAIMALSSKQWVLAFAIGEACGCLYLMFSAQTTKEPFRLTILAKSSLKKTLLIVSGNIAGSLMTYMDRFFLFPTMGTAAVAWYTIASYMGKLVGSVLNPISSVLLTYFVRDKESVTVKSFRARVILFIILAFASLVLSVAVSDPILSLLYPTLVDDSRPYIFAASAGAALIALCNLIQPMMLAYADTKYQPIVQVSYLIVYFFFAAALLSNFGLLGFCNAVIISNIFRFAMMFAITQKSVAATSSQIEI